MIFSKYKRHKLYVAFFRFVSVLLLTSVGSFNLNIPYSKNPHDCVRSSYRKRVARWFEQLRMGPKKLPSPLIPLPTNKRISLSIANNPVASPPQKIWKKYFKVIKF